MAVRPFTPRVDVTGRALLLAEQGDVRLIDLTGPDGAGELEPQPSTTDWSAHGGDRPVGARVATARAVSLVVAAGAGLIVVSASLAVSPTVLEAHNHGVVVIVSGSPEVAGAAGLELLGSGGPGGLVVVEAPVVPHRPPLDAAAVAQLAELGLLAGVSFPPLPAVSDEAVGWEIGTLTRLLAAGVCTFRGVQPERFARVRAVCEAAGRARPASS